MRIDAEIKTALSLGSFRSAIEFYYLCLDTVMILLMRDNHNQPVLPHTVPYHTAV